MICFACNLMLIMKSVYTRSKSFNDNERKNETQTQKTRTANAAAAPIDKPISAAVLKDEDAHCQTSTLKKFHREPLTIDAQQCTCTLETELNRRGKQFHNKAVVQFARIFRLNHSATI